MMMYLEKIILLIKEIKNPFLFLYHCYHYLNRTVPVGLAKAIARRNKRNQVRGEVCIRTLDGSDQVVHPDIVMYHNKIVLICTPYPYGMEEYENPSLYIGDVLYNMKPMLCPLDYQSKHKQGIHMSDPCMVASDNKLLCIYRETKFKEDFIYVKSVSINKEGNVEQSKRHLLINSINDFILSPAVLLYDKLLYMYHVRLYANNKSHIVLNVFDKDNYRHKNSKVVLVQNEPSGYYLWHISINAAEGFGKNVLERGALAGLFLYISQEDTKITKLYYSYCDNIEQNSWVIIKEISMPSALIDDMLFPYKSCFIPNTDGNILLSYRDTKKRNRLFTIKNQI